MSLLNRTSLTFKRPNRKDEYDENGRPIERENFQTIFSKGNLQPFLKGTTHINLPEGISSESAWTYFTKTELRGSNQGTGYPADFTTIKGDEYIVFNDGDWNQQAGVRNSHYEVILVKKDNKVR